MFSMQQASDAAGIQETDFVSGHLAVKIWDGNKKKKVGHYFLDDQLECDLNMVIMLL